VIQGWAFYKFWAWAKLEYTNKAEWYYLMTQILPLYTIYFFLFNRKPLAAEYIQLRYFRDSQSWLNELS